MDCTNCGAPVSPGAAKCKYCGAPAAGGFSPQSTINSVGNSMGNALQGRNRITAAVLGFFLGTFGAHWFYLGEKIKGFIFLVFFWTGIPTILGIIDAVILLAMSDSEFQRKHGVPA